MTSKDAGCGKAYCKDHEGMVKREKLAAACNPCEKDREHFKRRKKFSLIGDIGSVVIALITLVTVASSTNQSAEFKQSVIEGKKGNNQTN